jgi:hypothetical protein
VFEALIVAAVLILLFQWCDRPREPRRPTPRPHAWDHDGGYKERKP